MRGGAGWRRLLTILLLTVAVGYLAATTAANWEELRGYEWEVDAAPLALSVLAQLAVFAWGVFIWSVVLRGFPHPPVPYPLLLRIWFVSGIARYIPGKVWQFVAAAQLAREASLPGVLLLTSLLVHTGFSLLAAGVVSALALPELWEGAGVSGTVAVGATLAAGVAAAHPAVLGAAMGVVRRALRRDLVAWEGSWGSGILILSLSVGSWLLYGAAFHLFVRSLTPLSDGLLLPLAAVNAFSFLAGYLVLLAPAGLGVREATMTALLVPYVPPGVAAVVAILSRLWTVAAEVAGATAATLYSRRGAGPR